MANYDGAIFVGHGTSEVDGSYDPGATSNGKQEHIIAEKIVDNAVEKCKKVNLNIHRDEQNYKDNDLKGNTYNLKYAMSVHLNGGGGTRAELFTPCREKTLDIEFYILDELSKLGLKNGGVKSRDYNTEKVFMRTNGVALNYSDYYGEISRAWSQGISLDIIELGFIDSSDINIVEKNIDKIGTILANAMCKLAGKPLFNTGSNGNNNIPIPEPSGEMYRIRKSWGDASSQKGAYSDLNNAKKECDKYSGYNVYNKVGTKVYPENSITPPTLNEMYRVRKSWTDASSQKGAYSDLENAKNECKKYSGYSVYNNAGKSVFSTSPVVAPPTPPLSNKKYLNLKPHMQNWKIYNQNGPYTTNKAIASLAPAKFGGLSYEILGSPQTDVHLIQTEQFGKVAIYAPRDNDSSITTTKLY